LRTPGLAGTAVAHVAGSAGMRSAELTTGALDAALQEEGMQPFETIEISGTREVPTAAPGTRSTELGEPAIELTVPDPGAEWGQVVLAVDEAGSVAWHFARDAAGAVDVTRGSATRTYLIPRGVMPAAAPSETRGLLGAVGKKVLKVLVFRLLDPVVGEVSDHLAARWEAAKRAYRVRSFTGGNYQSAEAELVEPAEWGRLASGRALLLVHGTFSRAHSAFGGMPGDFVAWLHQRYEGRVFAFDHFTLSDDPRENIDWLVAQIPDATNLELDIICHSRGGLVSRLLSEQAATFALGQRRINVAKVVFLATPNAGTALADAEHLGKYVDAVTNVLNLFPDVGVTDVLEAVITVVKQLAVGAVGGLDGLTSMLPGGPFLTKLNAAPRTSAQYYALAANYEPRSGAGLRSHADDLVRDLIFKGDNDLVVPTAGVYEVDGSANFPIAERHVFGQADGLAHSSFARNAAALGHIRRWLEP
jgi:hypothetical protein